MPEFKKQKKKLEEEGRDCKEITAQSKNPIRDACQSAGPVPALSPRKLCPVTILPGTGEQPGFFLRSCELSDKLVCVIGNRSETHTRST